MLRHGRALTGAIAILAFMGFSATAQAAETVYGVTGGAPSLVRFSSATPGTIESTKPVTALQTAETILGIDVRPATGELMALGSTGRLYRIDPTTAVAAQVGAGAIALAGARFGVDFDPTADRLRVVSDAERNLRVNPLDGTVDGGAADADLAPPGEIVAAAYDRNTPGAAQTTLFALDAASDRLVRIGGVGSGQTPAAGVVTDIGATGVDFAATAGFDVAASDGSAYASLSIGATTSLYTIDLAGGAASKVADIGAAVVDIAVAQPRLTYYWTAAGTTTLVQGRTDAPAFSQPTALTGFAARESVVGLDQRPASGDLVALTNQDRLYLVDPVSASAAQIGTAQFAPAVGSSLVGLDFNPTADRLRVVADNEQNLRLNPISGAITAVDALLAPAGEITAAAYLNSFPGAKTTVLYDLDSVANTLLKQDPPNSGTLTTIGPLQSSAAGAPTFDIGALNGFDIAPAGGFGFLLGRGGGAGSLKLLRVNLAETAVTGGRIVSVGDIGALVDAGSLAIMSPGLLTAGSTSAGETGAGTATVLVVRSGGRSGPATVHYATADGSATAGQDYMRSSGIVRFADSENAKAIDVPLIDDAVVEGRETFTLTLSRPGEGAVLAPTPATVTITSDDAPPPVPPRAPAAPARPAPPAPAPDKTRPLAYLGVSAGQKLRRVRSKGLRLKLAVAEPATATLSATIPVATAKRLRISRRIATGRATFTAAAVKSLTLKLTAKAGRALSRSRRPVAVTVTATLTDAARNVSKVRGSGVLAQR